MRYEQCKFGCDRPINERTLLQTKVPIRLNLGFKWTDFPDTLQLTFPTHALQAA